MITTTVTVPGYTNPNRTQSQAAFNVNISGMFDYIGNNLHADINNVTSEINDTVDEINTTQTEINATAAQVAENALIASTAKDISIANSNAQVYPDGSPYSVGDRVIGSDGGTYSTLIDGANEDPAGSVTGNYATLAPAQLLVSNETTDFFISYTVEHRVDTTGGEITGTMPSNPQSGHRVYLMDLTRNWMFTSMYLDGGGENIEGSSELFEIDENVGELVLEYIDATTGWRVR